MATIYKICTADEWRKAVAAGAFRGSPADLRDGFVHFSSAEQMAETAARYFAGQTDLVLVAFDEAALGPGLKYEPSRGGALFPHLYGPLDPATALWVEPLPVGGDGLHLFPERAR
jgi:uncharacterized protein (DUF952 family)